MTAVALARRGSRATLALALLYGLAAFALALTAGALAMWAADPHDNRPVALLLLSGLVAIGACHASAQAPQRHALALVLGAAALMRVLCLTQPPILSTDIYRYVWDGRVQAAGINPYRYVPADPALAALRDQAIYPKINRADYAPTAYPPVAQMVFLAVTRVSESVLAMRLAFVACEVAIVALLWSLLRALGRPPTAIAAYAWHPLAVWEVSGSGHVEALMVALVMLGVWLMTQERRVSGGVAVMLAALVKPYAAVVLPAFWRAGGPKAWDWRLPVAVIATLIACYLPYASVGASVLGFIPAYTAEEGLRSGDAFWLVFVLRRLIGDVPGLVACYYIAASATLAWLGFRAAWRTDATPERRIRDIALLLMAGLFFLSPHYPWYYLVLVPFIPLGGGAPAWVLSVGGLLLYIWWPADDANTRLLLWRSLLNIAFLVTFIVSNARSFVAARLGARP